MKQSYYAIIPANIRFDKRLTDKAKLLYGDITSLCNEKGYCWASNSYFARLYDVDRKTTQRLISSLSKMGYIKVEVIRNEETKKVIERKISIIELRENIEYEIILNK